MKETFDDFFCRQLDFVPTLVKFLFANPENHLTVKSGDGNVCLVYVNMEGRFRRKRQKNGKEIDEAIVLTIDDAIAISSQLEVNPSDYPEIYANKKEEIKAIVKEYYSNNEDDVNYTDAIM